MFAFFCRSRSVAMALAGALACGGPAPASDHFGPAVLVSAETENGATPMYLTTPRGDRVLSWVSAQGGGADGVVHFAVTPAGAAEPLPTVTVRDPLGPIEPHGESPPRLAAGPDGTLYLLYLVGREIPGRRFPASALRFVRSEDLGRSWSPPVTVNDRQAQGDFGGHNFHALTTGPGGTLLASWLESGTGRSEVRFSRSSDGGRTWQTSRSVGGGEACPCCRTGALVGADGSLYIAWRAVGAGDVREVVVARSADGGGSWSPPVRVQTDGWVYPGCPHAGPALALDSAGTVHVAWWSGKEGHAGVFHARSTDGGQTWAAQPLAVGVRSSPAHVQLATAAGGRVVAAWDDGLGRGPRILLRRSADGGRTFGPVEPVSDAGQAATFPVLGVYGDSVAVAWSQMSEAHHRAREGEAKAMRDPAVRVPLPRVGQSEIVLRAGRL